MKKTIILLGFLALLSCKKDYTCVTTSETSDPLISNSQSVTVELENVSKQEVEDYESSGTYSVPTIGLDPVTYQISNYSTDFVTTCVKN